VGSNWGNKDKPAWEPQRSTRSIEHCMCSWERFFNEVMSKEEYINNMRSNPINKCTGIKSITKKQHKLKNIERLREWQNY